MPRSREPASRRGRPGPGAAWPPGLALLVLPVLVAAQAPEEALPPPTSNGEADAGRSAGAQEGGAETPETPPVEYSSPYAAWDAGAYDQALRGFADRQTQRPDDPELSLNVGAAHYKLEDFEAADGEFYRAAAIGDDELRAQALYNLGNSAYRQGKLEDAVDFYRSSLEANPDDLDAKFNLEFVREEMRQRQQQDQGGQDQDQDRQEQEEEQEEGEGAQQQSEEGGDQPPGQQQEQGDRGRDEQPRDGQGPQDSDGDGLDDRLERNADNPTDPRNPDSDADGLPDGQEDRNRNGRVDPGETDPNRRDSDGDGVPDAADPDSAADGPESDDRGGPGELPPDMTPEEAERYLQALEEGRPDPTRRGQRGRRSRQAKDW